MKVIMKYEVNFHVMDYANDELFERINVEVSRVPQKGDLVKLVWQGKPETFGKNGFEVIDVLHTYELSEPHEVYIDPYWVHDTDFEYIDVYLKERK